MASVRRLRFILGVLAYGVEQGEENAAEGGLAAGGVVPLLQGVDAAACTARAEGDGGDVEGHWEIGVG